MRFCRAHSNNSLNNSFVQYAIGATYPYRKSARDVDLVESIGQKHGLSAANGLHNADAWRILTEREMGLDLVGKVGT
jgi:hypothetical protein